MMHQLSHTTTAMRPVDAVRQCRTALPHLR